MMANSSTAPPDLVFALGEKPLFAPDGTDDYSEEQLAALVTRDTMIGVVPARLEGRTS